MILTEIAKDRDEASRMFTTVLQNGKALKYFRNFVKAQNGNPNICEDTSLLPQAKFQIPIIALKKGWVKSIDTQNIGYALVDIGAGRKTIESKLNYAAGAYLPIKVGHFIEKNSKIGNVFCDDEKLGYAAADKIAESYKTIASKAKYTENYIKEMELIYGLESGVEE